MLNSKAISAAFASSILLLASCSPKPESAPPTPSNQSSTPSTISEETKPQKYDGPFGLKMGLSRPEAETMIGTLKPIEDNPSWASARTVPVPHPDFESYSLQFSEKSGLCAISGIGKDIQSGSSGAAIQSQFESLDEALTSKYGTGKKYDFSSDRYDNPEFWMLHMLQKNRTLAKSWDKDSKATLSSDLSSVLIQANASDISTGYVNIRYEFTNIADCEKEAKAKRNQAL